jgi:hypothetical protein
MKPRGTRVKSQPTPPMCGPYPWKELTGLLDEAGLQNVKAQFYKHEFGLEQVLKGSFPNPGDAYQIRQLFIEDLGVDGALVGGHCVIGDNVYLSDNCAVRQFVRIGRLAWAPAPSPPRIFHPSSASKTLTPWWGSTWQVCAEPA